MAGIPFIDRWGITHNRPGYDPDLSLLQEQIQVATDLKIKIVSVNSILKYFKNDFKNNN